MKEMNGNKEGEQGEREKTGEKVGKWERGGGASLSSIHAYVVTETATGLVKSASFVNLQFWPVLPDTEYAMSIPNFQLTPPFVIPYRKMVVCLSPGPDVILARAAYGTSAGGVMLHTLTLQDTDLLTST